MNITQNMTESFMWLDNSVNLFVMDIKDLLMGHLWTLLFILKLQVTVRLKIEAEGPQGHDVAGVFIILLFN